MTSVLLITMLGLAVIGWGIVLGVSAVQADKRQQGGSPPPSSVAALANAIRREGFRSIGGWSPLNDCGPQPSGLTYQVAPGLLGAFKRFIFRAYIAEVPTQLAPQFAQAWPYCWDDGYHRSMTGADLVYGDGLVYRIRRGCPEAVLTFRRILDEWAQASGVPTSIL